MDQKSFFRSGRCVAVCIGLVYIYFGVLKFFPGVSPAEELAKSTINILTFGLIPSYISIILLAVWELVVGLLLLSNLFKRFAITLALIHMACTFTPLFLLPDVSFNAVPIPTLVGQYIFKNIIIVAVLLMIYPGKWDADLRS